MPRMIDLVRKSQMSANMMHAAARGALAAPPAEMMEILVHLALHNKVFGEQARMTLAGWDEKASLKVAADPATSREVLEYLISPRNIRPTLLPALLENPAITDEELREMAANGSRTVVEAMLLCERVKKSPSLKEALRSNPRLRSNEMATLDSRGTEIAAPSIAASAAEPASEPMAQDAPGEKSPAADADALAGEPEAVGEGTADDAVLAEAIDHYLHENAAELAAVPDKAFEEVPATAESLESTSGRTEGTVSPAVKPSGTAAATQSPPAAKHFKKHLAAEGERRDSTLQKIAKLDIKGRIALAMRGNKEERSILIRDSTKLVALAVLESPKISDGEVEKFALQKNVLEAVLRQIPLKRRFAKNYTIMRNLVYNPRTPLDLSLGLMKNLLIHDLKNLSGNKEVSDTIRKLALRMFKQKMEKKD